VQRAFRFEVVWRTRRPAFLIRFKSASPEEQILCRVPEVLFRKIVRLLVV
jgi:hypothetical protein